MGSLKLSRNAVVNYIKRFIATTRYNLGGCVLVNAWVLPSFLGIKRNNFGDDINKPLLESLTGKHVSFVCKVNNQDEHILAIGSIIDSLTTENSVIWGAGYLTDEKPLLHKPKRVCAVRGPLTRKVLLSYGVECPEVYGDPALLLPYVYSPHKNVRYKYGIIPHFHDYNATHVKHFRETHPEVLFIKMKNYKSWKDVICEICSCERIISSSLHGLIVADAYKIPNVYVQFSDMVEGNEFKFQDYMYGVGREYHAPLDMKKTIDLKDTEPLFASYISIDYNPSSLLHAFPYIKNSF